MDIQHSMSMALDTRFHIWFIWQFITKCDRYYYKMRQLLYYKMQQKFITKCIRFFITKCDSYYKMRRFYKNIWQLLQNVTEQQSWRLLSSWKKIEEPVTSVKSKTWLRLKSRSEVLFSYVLIFETMWPRCELIKGTLQNLTTSTCTKEQHIFNQKINFRWLLINSFVLSDSHEVMNTQ